MIKVATSKESVFKHILFCCSLKAYLIINTMFPMRTHKISFTIEIIAILVSVFNPLLHDDAFEISSI